MYIEKDNLSNGYNEYVAIDSPNGRLALMDVGLLVLDAQETYRFNEAEKETAILLLEGNAAFKWESKSVEVSRKNPFDYNPWCLHLSCGTQCEIQSYGHCELYIQKTYNHKLFESKLYSPEETLLEKAGINGELNGCMRRNIRTIFDYGNAPYSNMVLGETINFPGLWSSYPPHWHPQPEVYFYRYDKPQGFGAGFANGKVYETHHNGLLLIAEQSHPQVAAPGYALYIVWGIRHLKGCPWNKTRINDERHNWLLETNPE